VQDGQVVGGEAGQQQRAVAGEVRLLPFQPVHVLREKARQEVHDGGRHLRAVECDMSQDSCYHVSVGWTSQIGARQPMC